MRAFYSHNRILFWILLFLIALNLGAFITWFLVSRPAPPPEACVLPSGAVCVHLSHQLGLDAGQSERADMILADFRSESEPLAHAIRETRGAIMKLLSEEPTDSNRLNLLINDLVQFQTNLQKVNFRQYLALKEICTPEQAERLSELYLEIHGCPMKSDTGGVQHQHRHRRGQD